MGPRGTKMMISIIMLTKNSEKELPTVLSSLKKAVQNLEYELIIVGGESSDGTVQVAKQIFPHAKFLTETGRGLSYARQVGFNYSKGEYVAYIDSDICVPKDFFTKVLQNFELDEKIGVVAAKFFPFPEYDKGLLNQYYRSLDERHRGQKVSEFVPFCGTACTVYKDNALEKVNFDHRFKRAAEDKHIARQITESDFRIYFDSSIYCEHSI